MSAPGQRVERPLLAFGLLWLAYFATIGVFSPYAPLWFKSLGMSTIAIGAISSLQSWTRLLAPYAWSWAADHSGQRVALIRWAAGGALLAAVALALAPWLVATLGSQSQGAPGATSAGAEVWLVIAVVPALVALLFVANGGVVPLAESALSQLLTNPASSLTTLILLFLPLVMASGGNAGSQSATLFIRMFALQPTETKGGKDEMMDRRLILREFVIGLCLGGALASLDFAVAWLWFGLRIPEAAAWSASSAPPPHSPPRGRSGSW